MVVLIKDINYIETGEVGWQDIIDNFAALKVAVEALQAEDTMETLTLTNDLGAALTEDSDMAGMYKITMAGAGDAIFYLSHDGTIDVELITDQFFVDAAVTLAHTLEIYADGGWLSVAPYETGAIAADGSSQKVNASYPLRDAIPSGTKTRVKLAVSGACDVFCRVIAIGT